MFAYLEKHAQGNFNFLAIVSPGLGRGGGNGSRSWGPNVDDERSGDG